MTFTYETAESVIHTKTVVETIEIYPNCYVVTLTTIKDTPFASTRRFRNYLLNEGQRKELVRVVSEGKSIKGPNEYYTTGISHKSMQWFRTKFSTNYKLNAVETFCANPALVENIYIETKLVARIEHSTPVLYANNLGMLESYNFALIVQYSNKHSDDRLFLLSENFEVFNVETDEFKFSIREIQSEINIIIVNGELKPQFMRYMVDNDIRIPSLHEYFRGNKFFGPDVI